MEGFTYVDIFATKGIEYIIVIVFLAVSAIIYYFVYRPAGSVGALARRAIPSPMHWFRIPEAIYYHQGHTWALPEGSDVVKVGIDDFAHRLVGKIEGIEALSNKLIQGERGFALKIDGRTIHMLSPVDGNILEINEEMLKNPERLSEDPYGNGWLFKVKVPNFKANLRNLITGRLAIRWMDMVREGLFSRMNYNLGLVYQDGGIPVQGMAKGLDPERWEDIVREFFLTKEG